MLRRVRQSELHRSGQLEHVEKIDRLPPTPVSPEARQQLVDWGISEKTIRDLQRLTSSFRYDLCLQKIQRLAKIPAYLEQNQYHNSVWMPNFYDTQGRMDGQCGDITRQLVVQMTFSGLLDRIRLEARKSKAQLSLYFCWGQSKTHFCQPNQSHVWCQLVDVFPQGKNSIVIDGAFQTIDTLGNSGYRKVNSLDTKNGFGWIPLDEGCRVGDVDFFSGIMDVSFDDAVILGISSDKKYVYGLGFFQLSGTDRQKDPPLPAIIRIDSLGRDEFFAHHPNTQELLSEHASSLSKAEEAEITALLSAAKNISFFRDVAQYPGGNKPNQNVKFAW